MTDTAIVRSTDRLSTTAAQVGGKAASLLTLVGLGEPVPPFFVVTAAAYRAAADGRVDAALREAIASALAALGGEGVACAVRSSSVAEDSAEHSFAGVFETFLDVRGLEAIVASVEQCFASHRSARADAYRAARAIGDDAAMAVVVQRLVRAEWAGVSFSADPLAQALSVTVINAAEGLGEELVSGRINPEELRLDTASGRLLEAHRPPGAREFPEALRREVLAATTRVAARLGFPQDLEWAIEGGRLWLLQSRPITTLAAVYHNRALEPWLGQGDPDAAARVWTRAYADEIWTPPVTPLFYDIHNLTVVTTGRIRNDGDTAPLPPDMFKYFRAAPYMDAEVLLRLYSGLPRLARRDTLRPMFPPELRDRLQRAPWRWWAWARRLWVCEVQKGPRWGLTRNHRFLARSWPAFLARARALMDLDVTTLDEAGLAAHINDVWGLAGSVAPECEVAVLYYAHDIKLILAGLLDRWCGAGEQRYGEVSAGLDAAETVRESDGIWSLAETVRGAGAAAIDAARAQPWSRFRALAAGLGAGAVVGEFEAFLRDHRHRGANYKEFLYPRWGDDPERLWVHVQAFLGAPAPRPGLANAAGATRRRAAQRALLAGLKGPLAPMRRLVLRALFRGNEVYAGIRDNHRFYYDHVWYLVRRAYLDTGRRLAALGRLASAEDALFLVRAELDALARGELGRALAATRIALRRREWHETKAVQPPKFLRRGYVGDATDHAHPPGGRVFTGLAASAGQVTGRARVLRDVSELGRVAPGDILVARQTDPGWTPAFARIAGLVLETGGVLAHGASLCREYGLPCVTAVEGATLLIGEGDAVSVDGGAGRVEILERATPTAST